MTARTHEHPTTGPHGGLVNRRYGPGRHQTLDRNSDPDRHQFLDLDDVPVNRPHDSYCTEGNQ